MIPPPPPEGSTQILEQTVDHALEIIRPGFHMGLDLVLALIPFFLALLIFRKDHPIRPVLWWPVWGIFILFLPNAPYVLTDVIHFVAKVRVSPPLPLWAMGLLLLQYFFYFLIGMECFTLSLMLWGRFLRRRGNRFLILPMEWIVLSASSFGMYLGRFERFNSWDFLTTPEHLISRTLIDALGHRPEEITLLFLGLIALVYYLLKGANLLVVWTLRTVQAPSTAEKPDFLQR